MMHEFFAPYIKGHKLQIGCGKNKLPGWVNADLCGHPDIQFDLREVWPIADATFDTVFASHTLEHFAGDDLFHIMYEAGRVLKVGGHLLGVTPYGFSTLQLACPFHKQIWTEHTPCEFDRRKFDVGGSHEGMDQGTMLQPWTPVAISLLMDEKWKDTPTAELAYALRHYLNIASEMLFVMRREP